MIGQASLCERRAQARVGTIEYAELSSGLASLDVQVLDVSPLGAKLRARTGLLPLEGDECVLRLADHKYLVANVAWIDGGHLGLRLIEEFADAYRLNWLEDRGDTHLRAVLRAPRRR